MGKEGYDEVTHWKLGHKRCWCLKAHTAKNVMMMMMMMVMVVMD